MSLIFTIPEALEAGQERVGGKAFCLAAMAGAGFDIPHAVFIGTDAYRRYVTETGLHERIMLELNRKDFADMRWEEMWDAALRIRNLLLNTPLPETLGSELKHAIADAFGDKPVAVRSSAPGEDSAAASFAGLHESYLNIRGPAAVLEHVRLVWASLWSDRALLYRQELKLDVSASSMAVVIQELIPGERSGVVFGQNPSDSTQVVIEAVHGLNEGLVDGTIEPDRWILARDTGAILLHTPPVRDRAVVLSDTGTCVVALDPKISRHAPLTAAETGRILGLVRRGEAFFGRPQDMEWTVRADTLYTLQARPITTAGPGEDKRTWYLSLTRSYENLKTLRSKIEQDLIPAMDREAEQLAAIELATLTDAELADQIEMRSVLVRKWTDVYWEDFIPFAHGVRLFGQVYNDMVRPEDPFAFTELLTATDMASLDRNRVLAEMAGCLRQDPALIDVLRTGRLAELPEEFRKTLADFEDRFGNAMELTTRSEPGRAALAKVLAEMAKRDGAMVPVPDAAKRERKVAEFLACFDEKQRQQAHELLDLARASYRLRDDDNIHLGRIEQELRRALRTGQAQLDAQHGICGHELDAAQVVKALRNPDDPVEPSAPTTASELDPEREIQARQLIGQPAGAGLATARARVVLRSSDLFEFKAGEVLICDAVDPNMTFIVPLAAAVVERRGGMLIHGAIIAREYGLPCVTGVPEATTRIPNGAVVTVDGYLGIVTVAARSEPGDEHHSLP